jgi:hypothetical protein
LVEGRERFRVCHDPLDPRHGCRAEKEHLRGHRRGFVERVGDYPFNQPDSQRFLGLHRPHCQTQLGGSTAADEGRESPRAYRQPVTETEESNYETRTGDPHVTGEEKLSSSSEGVAISCGNDDCV